MGPAKSGRASQLTMQLLSISNTPSPIRNACLLLIDYLGLEWDEKCLDFHNNDRNVMSPSNIQVRQPMYKNSINRWKLYEKQLQPLIEVLQQAS